MSVDARLKKLETATGIGANAGADDARVEALAQWFRDLDRVPATTLMPPAEFEAFKRELDDAEREREAIQAAALVGVRHN